MCYIPSACSGTGNSLPPVNKTEPILDRYISENLILNTFYKAPLCIWASIMKRKRNREYPMMMYSTVLPSTICRVHNLMISSLLAIEPADRSNIPLKNSPSRCRSARVNISRTCTRNVKPTSQARACTGIVRSISIHCMHVCRYIIHVFANVVCQCQRV